jgi:hypothetical protein
MGSIERVVGRCSGVFLRIALTLGLFGVLSAPAIGQQQPAQRTCPQVSAPTPVAGSTTADVLPLSPPNLSANKDSVWYVPAAAGAQDEQQTFETLRQQLHYDEPPRQLGDGDQVSVDNPGEGLLSFADPNLDNSVAWRVRIFRDSQFNLCAEATYNSDLAPPVMISLFLGALLANATPEAVAGRQVEVRTDYAVIRSTPQPVLPDADVAAQAGLSAAQTDPNAGLPEFFVYNNPALGTWVVVVDGNVTVSTLGCDPEVDSSCQVTLLAGQQTVVQPNQSPNQAVAATRANLPAGFPTIDELTGCAVAESEVLKLDAFAAAPAACATPTPTETVSPTPTPTAGPPHSLVYGAIVAGPDHASKVGDLHFTQMWMYVDWSSLIDSKTHKFLFDEMTRFGTAMPNELTDVVTTARQNQLRLVLRLDNPPGKTVSQLSPAEVEDYTFQAVSYGQDVIDYVEVFNELNRPDQWGGPPNPTAYVPLLNAAYAGAKKAKPSVVVVTAAPSQRTGGVGGSMEDVEWLEGLYAAPGQKLFDALGMHAYLGTSDPTTDAADCQGLCFRDIDRFRAVMDAHGDDRPAFITEMGALEQTSIHLSEYFDWMKLDPDTRANYLVKALQRAASSQYVWLRGAMIQNLDFAVPGEPATPEQPWFALLNPDLSPRLAYSRIREARASGQLP